MTARDPQPDLSTGPFWRSPLFLVPLALVIAIVVAILIYWDLLGFEKRAYIASNQEIHDTLPVFPGALLLETRSSAQGGDGNFSLIEGYTTRVIFRMPANTTWDDVLAFYETELAGAWEVWIDSTVLVPSRPAILSLNARPTNPRQASVLVEVDRRSPRPGDPPGNQYVVLVDHDHSFPVNPPPDSAVRQ